MSPSRFVLPDQPGAYRWYYADVTAGKLTAVVIFMVGAIFSPTYSVKGGRPIDHCAVNLALYRNGVRRRWVLSEYSAATIDADGRTLRIGGSALHCGADGRVRVRVVDRTAPWGRRSEASLELIPVTGPLPETRLIEGQPHFWQPLAPRCEATLEVEATRTRGLGYQDTNWGEAPLGAGVPGWKWLRVHRADATEVLYEPRGCGQALRLIAGPWGSRLDRIAAAPAPERSTGWGLKVPRSLRASGCSFEAPRLIESSPFYARFESTQGSMHALGEVADFDRFRRPWVRWLAGFRTRAGAALPDRGGPTP